MLGRLGQLFDAIEQQAERLGHAIVASAVDRHGNVMLTMRMDGAPVHSIDLATRKAFTAVDMGSDTMALARKNAPGEELFGLDVATGGKLVLLGGGDVVELVPGERIGVGISGSPTKTDIAILRGAVEQVGRADGVAS